jgi:hypothetical protein
MVSTNYCVCTLYQSTAGSLREAEQYRSQVRKLLLVGALSGTAVFFYFCRRNRTHVVRVLGFMLASIFSSFSVPALYPAFLDIAPKYVPTTTRVVVVARISWLPLVLPTILCRQAPFLIGIASVPITIAMMFGDGFIPYILDTSGSWRVVTLLLSAPLALSAVVYGFLGDSTPIQM